MPTYRMKFRCDTKSEWLRVNPILLRGEMGLEYPDDGAITASTSLLFKIGDGVFDNINGTVTGTAWKDLPYVSGPQGLQGPQGIQGQTGASGFCPDHEWSGTSLRFQNPDGSWGNYTNLVGPQGATGEKGEPGLQELVPASRTKLGSVIIGNGINLDAKTGCISVPDQLPIGTICMWSGKFMSGYPVNAKTGSSDARWYMCNGATVNGIKLPDLRKKFILGSGGNYAIGDEGGSEQGEMEVDIGTLETDETTLSVDQMPTHDHVAGKKVTGIGYHGGGWAAYDNKESSFSPWGPGLCLSGTAGGGLGHKHTLSAGSLVIKENFPSYYVLAFIMKISS